MNHNWKLVPSVDNFNLSDKYMCIKCGIKIYGQKGVNPELIFKIEFQRYLDHPLPWEIFEDCDLQITYGIQVLT